MKKISKLLMVVLFISFVLPGVALASWWNPFSWFKKSIPTPDKTEILEKRIRELEAKLNISTSTVGNSTSSNLGTKIINTETIPDLTKEKFNEYPITASDLVVNFTTQSIKNADLAKKGILDLYIEPIKKRMANNKMVNTIDEKGLNTLYKADEMSLDYYNNSVNNIDLIITQLVSLKDIGYTEKAKAEKTFYNNKSSAKIEGDRIMKYMDQEKVLSDAVSKIYREIVDYDKKYQDDYMNFLTMWRDLSRKKSEEISSFQLPPAKTYQSITIPQIQKTSITTCTGGLMGGTRAYYTMTCN
jgi:hypothetical protein